MGKAQGYPCSFSGFVTASRASRLRMGRREKRRDKANITRKAVVSERGFKVQVKRR